MPTELSEDPKSTVYNTLKNNWTSGNTSSVTPTFSTGWYDRNAGNPQVTITNRDDTDGDGFQFMEGDGSGPVKDATTTLQINVWAHRDDGSGVNPKQLSFEMMQEVSRILNSRYDSIGDFFTASVDSPTEIVEAEQSPALFRYQFTFVGRWHKQTP